MPKKVTKNTKKKYWFKRKVYGFGWYPATVEAWIILLFYIIIVTWNAFRLDNNALTPTEVMASILPATVILTVILIIICYQTGESPIWQWGPNVTMPVKPAKPVKHSKSKAVKKKLKR